MNKKVLSFILTVALTLSLAPLAAAPVHAVSAGSVPGVNYNRILSTDTGGGHRVVLKLGDLLFYGELAGSVSLSRDEQDAIIRQVMSEGITTTENGKEKKHDWITSAMLEGAHSRIPAVDNTRGYTWSDVQDALMQLTGVSNVTGLYDALMGNAKSSADVAADITGTADTAKDIYETVQIYKKGGGKLLLSESLNAVPDAGIVFMAVDAMQIALEIVDRWQEIGGAIEDTLNATIFLNDFYGECNRRIRRAEEAKGVDAEALWKISFAGPRRQGVTATHNFNMWGIGGLMSEWTLTGVLVQTSTGAGSKYAGTYEGDLSLEIKGLDMDKDFDTRFVDTSYIGVKNQIAIMKAGGNLDNMNYTAKADSPTVLTRSIVWDMSVTVPEGSGEFPLNINSLRTVKDEQNISINQTVEGYGLDAKPGISSERWDEIKVAATSLESAQSTFRQWTAYSSVQRSQPKTELGSAETLTFEADSGTTWKPLESGLVITVYIN